MLQKIKTSQFALAVELLDEYLNEKRANNFLKGWIKLKSNNRKQSHHFSNASFAKPKSQASEKVAKATTSRMRPKGYTTKFSTYRDDYKDPPKYSKLKTDQSYYSHHRQEQEDDGFEDIILEKIKMLEQSLRQVKSRASSIRNDSFSRSSRDFSSRDEQGIKFTLNPRYIPMRQKLGEVESYVLQEENYQIPTNNTSDMDPQMPTSTPRIGSRTNIDSHEASNNILVEGINIINYKDKKINQRFNDLLQLMKECDIQGSLKNTKSSPRQVFSEMNALPANSVKSNYQLYNQRNRREQMWQNHSQKYNAVNGNSNMTSKISSKNRQSTSYLNDMESYQRKFSKKNQNKVIMYRNK